MSETASLDSDSASETARKGLVQIITGDGKGKTTSAVGGVVRALGQGLRVCVVVFMKGNRISGEWTFLSNVPGVKILRFGLGILSDPANIKPEEVEGAKQALTAAREAALSGDYDLVTMDEVNVALDRKLIEFEEVERLIGDKPDEVELVLTGRRADPRLVELADLVTECLKIKHPYEKGIKARRGIEY
ncbi:MAG: cob(I)yrinic acid a,c-diamide adenosyltransferase [Dehalococcoidales bacterium]|nr:cob(I)yrinic acid a,c-diamide adenosyltransferase [Dehalococcoidales bacterium]MDP6824610.1 cob(I)yrinic acid a,c-diamide adenosyltransferase [Dehalococcoidales bacterium]